MAITGSRARALRFRVFFLLAILAFYLCVVPVHQAVQAQFAELALGFATVANPYFLAFAGLCVAGGYVYYDWTHDGPLHQWWERSQAWDTLTRAFLLGAFRDWVDTPHAVLDVSSGSDALDTVGGVLTSELSGSWSSLVIDGRDFMMGSASTGTTLVLPVLPSIEYNGKTWFPYRVRFWYSNGPEGTGPFSLSVYNPSDVLSAVVSIGAGSADFDLSAGNWNLYDYVEGGIWRFVVGVLPTDGLPRMILLGSLASVYYGHPDHSLPQTRTAAITPAGTLTWDELEGLDVGLLVPGGLFDLVGVATGDFPSFTAPYAVPVSTWPRVIVDPDEGVVSYGSAAADPPIVDTSGWDAWFAGLQGALDWIALWAQTLAADLAERWMALNSRLGAIGANVSSLALQFSQLMVLLPTLPAQIAAAGVNAWADFMQPENPLGPRVESLKTSALGRFPLGLIPLISGLAGTFFAAECGGHTFTMGVPASPWAIEVDLPTDPAWAVNTKALSRVAVAVMAVTYLIGLGRRFLGLGG